MVARYDRERHHSSAFVYGQDVGVLYLAYLSWALWLLGYADQALKRSREAVGLRFLHLIRTDRGIQEGFAAHVYVPNEEVKNKLATAGIPLSSFTARTSERGRLYLFHRVSLFDPRE